MKKIASFTIDHIKLQPGIYVSRKDYLGDQVITTFDIRMTSPNEEPVMNTAELHAMEHLAATFLRNHAEFGGKVIHRVNIQNIYRSAFQVKQTLMDDHHCEMGTLLNNYVLFFLKEDNCQ